MTEKQSILLVSLKTLRSLSEHAHKLAFDSVFSQIDKHLHLLSESEVGDTSDMTCRCRGVNVVLYKQGPSLVQVTWCRNGVVHK